MDCTLGCRTLGYLVLTAQPPVFNNHCVTPFITPRNTGIHPVMPDPASTATILSELVKTYKHEVRLFNNYHAVNRACKKVISKLTSENLCKSFLSRIIDFAKVTSLEILTHLISKYEELKEEDIQEIDWKIKKPISGETLFKEFVKIIEWNQEAVAVQNPYFLAQIVSMAYANINNCGLYQDICRNCSRKPQSDKTWENFNTHFAQAFKDTIRSSRNSRTEGYVAHVHATQANAELFTEMHQDHTLALANLANLATATQADRTSVALLMKTILKHSSQVALLTAKLASVHAVNERITKSDQQSNTDGNGHLTSCNMTPLETNPPQYRNIYS